jgi:cold shock CspA family protein
MVGSIKFYKPECGYGFIQGENGEDIFFSYRTLNRDIRPGSTTVEYSEVTKGKKGLKAGKVKIIE